MSEVIPVARAAWRRPSFLLSSILAKKAERRTGPTQPAAAHDRLVHRVTCDLAAMPVRVFDLEEVAGGTLLRISESGFDSIPLERRASAFEMNEQGWEAQMTLIEKYLAQRA